MASYNEQQIKEKLKSLPGWELKDGKLFRQFKFKDFVQAFSFMTRVAIEAERLNHHPDWRNVWNTVEIFLDTHSAGAVTDLDFQLAEKINTLA